MASISATIHVSFISNYAGPHRVCWRINNTGPYDCSTIISCLGGGNSCSTDIPITVDNETCPSVEFDGYVQATCEVEGSLSGRVPFSTTFTPVPTCISYQILCNDVDVFGMTVNTHGSGYNPGSPPAVIITGGGGSLATAVAHIGNGGILTWTVTNGGGPYDGGGSATFVNVASTGGTGTGAFFNVTVIAGVITSIVLATNVTSPGSSYLVGDTLSFGNLGGTGAGTAIITINSLNTSQIQYISISANGSGYSSQAVATIDPPVGFGGNPNIQALATPVMGNCPEWTAHNCSSVSEDPLSVDLGTIYNLCSLVAPTPPINYNVTPLGCCYNCVSVTFTATVTDVTFSYVDCVTRTIVHTTLVGPTMMVPAVPLTVCTVNNAWWKGTSQGPVTILVGAPCS